MSKSSRRDFLKIAVAGAGAAQRSPRPALAAGKPITLLHESSFIKTFDEYMQKTLIPAYAKETGVQVTYEVTSVGSLPTRATTVAETGSGADITMNITLMPFLFADKYARCRRHRRGSRQDPGRLVRRRQGRRCSSTASGRAVPFANIGQLMNWRTDYFKEIGVTKFPDTWEELYEVGKKLKAKDHPFGFELGHGFGDNHGWLYPLLWSYGGAEVQPDGKTVVDRFRRDRQGDRFRPQVLQGLLPRGLPRLDRCQQQQGLDGRPDLVHQQRRKHPVVRQARLPGDRQGHRPGA